MKHICLNRNPLKIKITLINLIKSMKPIIRLKKWPFNKNILKVMKGLKNLFKEENKKFNTKFKILS